MFNNYGGGEERERERERERRERERERKYITYSNYTQKAKLFDRKL